MIEIEHLSKRYTKDKLALHNISLSIGGGMFGLVGPNGAGKTTLMRLIAGILQPSEGQVRVFGQDLHTATGRQAVKAQLGYLPQALGLYPNLTAREFLDYVAIIKGMNSKTARQQQVGELLEVVHLAAHADQRLKGYSGGMKQRIGIAQALLGNPKLLIVDEPTIGLDPEERVRFRNLLSGMAARCTIILSTHIIEDISHSCNDLAIINHGEVLFRGSPASLIQGARGHVWTVLTQESLEGDGLKIVSTVQYHDGIQYRVLGNVPSHYAATPAEPTLEDGYMWHMAQTAVR